MAVSWKIHGDIENTTTVSLNSENFSCQLVIIFPDLRSA